MLFDLYDDNQFPIIRTDDDNVSDRDYMMPKILDCIRNFGDSTQKTYSFPTLARRLVKDTNAVWYDSSNFNILRSDICQIFHNHQFYETVVDANYCKNINSAPNEENETNLMPFEFSVQQNYPNPFNSGTKIGFYLPDGGDSKISIYNIIGQIVWEKELRSQAAGEPGCPIACYGIVTIHLLFCGWSFVAHMKGG